MIELLNQVFSALHFLFFFIETQLIVLLMNSADSFSCSVQDEIS